MLRTILRLLAGLSFLRFWSAYLYSSISFLVSSLQQEVHESYKLNYICVLVSYGCNNKIPQDECLKPQKFISHCSGG